MRTENKPLDLAERSLVIFGEGKTYLLLSLIFLKGQYKNKKQLLKHTVLFPQYRDEGDSKSCWNGSSWKIDFDVFPGRLAPHPDIFHRLL